MEAQEFDPVKNPAHYSGGVFKTKPIDISADMSFLRGNAMKYILRHPYKGKPIEDLQKATFYLDYLASELSMARQMEAGEISPHCISEPQYGYKGLGGYIDPDWVKKHSPIASAFTALLAEIVATSDSPRRIRMVQRILQDIAHRYLECAQPNDRYMEDYNGLSGNRD